MGLQLIKIFIRFPKIFTILFILLVCCCVSYATNQRSPKNQKSNRRQIGVVPIGVYAVINLLTSQAMLHNSNATYRMNFNF